MRMVVAKCSVEYEGRLDASLAPALRLIMVKADGCVAVHSDGGAYKPLNWMNAPNRTTEEDGRWVVVSPKGETLTIVIDEVVSDVTVDLGTDPGLVKDGVESHLQELLAATPSHIEPGLALVRREHDTGIGPVDLLCRDAGGGAVAVEVKRVADIDGVEQLSRYLERLNGDPLLAPVRGILAGQRVKPQARTLARDRGIACAVVDYRAMKSGRPVGDRLF